MHDNISGKGKKLVSNKINDIHREEARKFLHINDDQFCDRQSDDRFDDWDYSTSIISHCYTSTMMEKRDSASPISCKTVYKLKQKDDRWTE